MADGTCFSNCLVERKDDSSRRAGRIRRRALVLSAVIQAALLTFLVLAPTFGAGESLVFHHVVPTPPWRGLPGKKGSVPRPKAPRRHERSIATHAPIFFNPAHSLTPERGGDAHEDEDPFWCGSLGDPPGDPNGLIPGMIGADGGLRLSQPPQPPEPPPSSRRLGPSEIQQAKIVHRVEPKYPAIARQIRLEGTVRLRAVIGRDGTVQSAEVLSGSPVFVQAALEAILEWRYQPTLLNRESIEVETLITVVFRLK
jgi:TonB family protein